MISFTTRFIRELFPFKSFNRNNINQHAPNQQYADLFAAIHQRRAFKSHIAHRIIQLF